MNKKKILRIAGIVVIVFAVIAVLLELFFKPPAPEAGTQESTYYDPKLEELRERNAELDDIFEGTATHVEPEYSDDLFATQGQLSDFDSFNEPNFETETRIEDSVEQGFVEDEPFEEAATSPFGHLPTADAHDELLVDSVDDDWDEIDHASFENSSEAEFGSLTENFPSPASQSIDLNQIEELVHTVINDAIQLALLDKESTQDRLAQHRHELDLINQRLETLPELTRQAVESALEGKHGQDTELLLAAMSERIDALESSLATQRRQAARPSAEQLRNLYRLERIAGNTVTLIGNNTGREFVFGLGDSIAYGGTVSRIQGDSVTLQWPNAQATLSIY